MKCCPCAQWLALVALVMSTTSRSIAAPLSERSPATSPTKEDRKFIVPSGFDVRLFASAPMIVNPAAMTWDARGRLWVVDLHEAPLSGKKAGRDQIKILEDIDADGKADKVSIFADKLRGATGILPGHGSVYVAEGSHIVRLEDKNGDDKPEKRTVISTALDAEDREALLHSLSWGPDGKFYMGYAEFDRPAQRNEKPIFVTGGVARFDTRTGHFERYAEGLEHSCALDFDGTGNAFIAAAGQVVQISPGGIYGRPGSLTLGGNPMPGTVGRPQGNAPINIYQGDQWPQDWRGVALHADPEADAIRIGRFNPAGSALDVTHSNGNREFLVTSERPFVPAGIQTGPDGAVWMIDSGDKYPWPQSGAPALRKSGHIWRVVWTGDAPRAVVPSRPSLKMNLAKLSSEEQATLVAHPNVWHRRMAQHLLTERGLTAFGQPRLHQGTPMHKIFEKETNTHVRLAALWTLHGAGFLEEVALDTAAEDKDPDIRRWAARLTGERGYLLKDSFDRLTRLAKDSDLSVRTASAIAARQFVSGDLTRDTLPKIPIREVATGGILSALFLNSSNNVDETFEFHFWMALEPIMAFDPNVVDYYHGNGARKQWPFSANVLRRITRLMHEMGDPVVLSRAIVEMDKISMDAVPALVGGLQGLLDGQQDKVLVPNGEAMAVISKLARSDVAEIAAAARQLEQRFTRQLK